MLSPAQPVRAQHRAKGLSSSSGVRPERPAGSQCQSWNRRRFWPGTASGAEIPDSGRGPCWPRFPGSHPESSPSTTDPASDVPTSRLSTKVVRHGLSSSSRNRSFLLSQRSSRDTTRHNSPGSPTSHSGLSAISNGSNSTGATNWKPKPSYCPQSCWIPTCPTAERPGSSAITTAEASVRSCRRWQAQILQPPRPRRMWRRTWPMRPVWSARSCTSIVGAAPWIRWSRISGWTSSRRCSPGPRLAATTRPTRIHSSPTPSHRHSSSGCCWLATVAARTSPHTLTNCYRTRTSRSFGERSAPSP